MALLGFLLYLFTFGATDTGGEQGQQAAALALGLYAVIAGRRVVASAARS